MQNSGFLVKNPEDPAFSLSCWQAVCKLELRREKWWNKVTLLLRRYKTARCVDTYLEILAELVRFRWFNHSMADSNIDGTQIPGIIELCTSFLKSIRCYMVKRLVPVFSRVINYFSWENLQVYKYCRSK